MYIAVTMIIYQEDALVFKSYVLKFNIKTHFNKIVYINNSKNDKGVIENCHSTKYFQCFKHG